jgi:leader peptidase (prepilin peptidase)/N-methyltransferase
LALRGHCRHCHTSIDVRYPIVELATALLFAGVAMRFGFNWDVPAFLLFFAGLLALSWIDIEHLVLPKRVVYFQLVLVAAALLADALISHQWRRLLVAVACSLGWFALFFILNLIDSHWLGFGDVRLALVLGLALGWLGVGEAALGFFAANLIGAIVGIALIASGKIERSHPIPYGVFLSVGAGAAVFAGPALLAPFH